MPNTLRQRIRPVKIRCLPWRVWKGEIEYLPISAKTLFARRGIPIDILETSSKSEGWLLPEEVLLEVLKAPGNLLRGLIKDIGTDEPLPQNVIPDDWTEEDYLCWKEGF